MARWSLRSLVPVLAFVPLLIAVTPAWGYEAREVPDGGTIAGSVRYGGTAAQPAKVSVSKDVDYCGGFGLRDESMLVAASGGLANVVVFLGAVASGRAAVATHAVLDNKNCHYAPHVMAVALGSEVAVRNSDPILHNTHARLPKGDVFNIALPRQGQEVPIQVTQKGMMKVGCDAGHTWMNAWIAVFDHPYFAVTDAEGRFSIPGVPPGTYELVYWHEKLGSSKQSLVVTAGATADGTLRLP